MGRVISQLVVAASHRIVPQPVHGATGIVGLVPAVPRLEVLVVNDLRDDRRSIQHAAVFEPLHSQTAANHGRTTTAMPQSSLLPAAVEKRQMLMRPQAAHVESLRKRPETRLPAIRAKNAQII